MTMVTGRPPDRAQLAFADLRDGILMWPLWSKLGWNDIIQRYRRSTLGPFWLTASMAVMVISLGVVYARIFKTDVNDFMPFLSVGLLFWGFISSVLTESSQLFTGLESHVKQIKIPYTVYIFRFVWARMIILAHNFVIYFGLLIFFKITPGFTILFVLPGFVLMTINAIALGLFIGMMSARFRDIPQLIASIVQVVFFITPVMWKPELLGEQSYFLIFNPLYHFIEVVRAPLLGIMPSLTSYKFALLMTIINCVVAGAFFVRFRARISYWV